MKLNSVEKELQRARSSQLRWGIGLLLSSIAYIGVIGLSDGGGWTYWSDFFGGPELVSNQKLMAEPSNYIGRYVKIVGSENIETSIQSTETIRYNDYVSRLIMLELDKTSHKNHTLFVQLKDETPADNSVRGVILSTTLIKMDDSTKSLMAKTSALPVVLDTTGDFYGKGQVGLGFSLLLGIAGAVTLFNLREKMKSSTESNNPN
jgi:hypothetical protein